MLPWLPVYYILLYVWILKIKYLRKMFDVLKLCIQLIYVHYGVLNAYELTY